MRFQHEIVTRTQPLSAWTHFHDSKAPQRVAPHWHQGIELSYTLSGHIDDFTINGRGYQTKSGSILVVNSQLIHSVQMINTADGHALSIIYPYDYVHRLCPFIEHEVIEINEPGHFSDQQSGYTKICRVIYIN